MNAALLEQIASHSGRLEKERLIATMDEDTKRLVAVALDTNITFGITTDDEDDWVSHWHSRPEGSFELPPNEFWMEAESISEDLAERKLTGNAARSAVDNLLRAAPSPIDAIWACRFFNKNLRAGFDIRTFNRVFGKGAIEKFEVQLADTYEGQILDGEWIFEPKLDGNRVVGYNSQPTSRGNKIYPAAEPIFEGLREIPGFLDEFVPDGEMMGNLGFDQSSGALRRTSGKGKKADFTYWLFDLFTAEEYDTQLTQPLRVRKERLKKFFETHQVPANVKMVPWVTIKDPTHKQVMAITEQFVKDGFEGAMAKRLDARAKFGRGPDLLKVKLFFEDDFKVVGFYEGKGQHKGTLGGIIVEGTIRWSPSPDQPKKTYQIRSECGSGFSHVYKASKPDAVLRDDVWNDKDGWMGAIVQIQFQNPTDKGSLRLPVFVMRRKDKE